MILNKFLTNPTTRRFFYTPVRHLSTFSKAKYPTPPTNDMKKIVMSYLATFALLSSGCFYLNAAYMRIALPRGLKGSPAPEDLKNNHPNKLVWPQSELNDDGQGHGMEGKSQPHKYWIILSNGEIMHGYKKESCDGRQGALNEIVYHVLAKRIIPDKHPEIKLIETKVSTDHVEYSLFIESIGENQSLLGFSKEVCKDTSILEDIKLENFGCALAFARLIRSNDAFLKNFVVSLHSDGNYRVYPIDFEQTDKSQDSKHRFIDLNSGLTTSQAAEQFMLQGAILEFKTKFTLNERLRMSSGGEQSSELGKAHIVLGPGHRDVLAAFTSYCAEDIINGKIINMYHNLAALTQEDVDVMLNTYSFIMKPSEIADYQSELLELIQEAQKFLSELKNTASSKKTDDEEKHSFCVKK